MVCAKCAAKSKPTALATPGVKRKAELYHGSSASAAANAKDKSTKSATVGHTGVGKSKLLSKAAKNPYAAYAASCGVCKTKVGSGRTYCHSCAYKQNGESDGESIKDSAVTDYYPACTMCGKSLNSSAAGSKPLTVQGQRFSAK